MTDVPPTPTAPPASRPDLTHCTRPIPPPCSYNIGQLAYLNAKRYNLSRIFFGGFFIRRVGSVAAPSPPPFAACAPC